MSINLEKRKEYLQKYYLTHKIKINATNKKWREENAERHNYLNKIRLQKLRLEVIAFMGGNCIKCGFEDKRALQIDHIKGGGTKEKKNSNRNRELYYKEILQGKRSDLQLLCANCNWIKMHENGEIHNLR